MARVIGSDVDSRVITPIRLIWMTLLIGVLSGLFFWLLTRSLNQYLISPIFCHKSFISTSCLNSLNISGNVATIIVAVAEVIVMVKFRIAQPLIVAIATGAALWGLAQWTDGLSIIEMILWSMAIYALAYMLFSWIVRYIRTIPVLVFIVIIVVAVRVAANF
jgi:hypothetical protein